VPPQNTDICLVIYSLRRGGAERQLLALAGGLAARGMRITIVTLHEGGAWELDDRFPETVTLRSLRKRGRWDLGAAIRAIRIIRAARPRIVYSMLMPSNLLCLLIRPFMGRARLVWGIRESGQDRSAYHWSLRLLHRLEVLLGRVVGLVIFNSARGARRFAERGFRPKRTAVVPNSIDCEYFKPDPSRRQALRQGWGFPSEALVFAVVGSLSPVKGHDLFFDAASKVAERMAAARFLIVGSGTAEQESRLAGLVSEVTPRGSVVLAGEHADMPLLYGAIDVLVLSSESEGFPNVVGEAMACGVPCVVTDVGDAATVVGLTGAVVRPRTASALAEGMLVMAERLQKEGDHLRALARQHILSEFGIDAMVSRTLTALGFPGSDGLPD